MLRNNQMGGMGGGQQPQGGADGGADWYNPASDTGTQQPSAYGGQPQYQQQQQPQVGGYGQQAQEPSHVWGAGAQSRTGHIQHEQQQQQGGADYGQYQQQHQQQQQQHSMYGQQAPIASAGYGSGGGIGGEMDFKNKGVYGVGIDEDYSNEPPLLEELGIHFDHIWLKTLSVVYPSKDLGHLVLISKMSIKSFAKYAFSGGRMGAEGLNVPTINASTSILNNKELDSDLTGPIIYCLLLGLFMLGSGKVNFGYIYGFSVICSMMLYQVLHLLECRVGGGGQQQSNASSPSKERVADSFNELSIWETCSILGYSLIPVVILSAISILINLRGYFGLILSAGTILWSTYSATRLFDVKMFLTANHQYWLVAYPVALFYACFTLITVF